MRHRLLLLVTASLLVPAIGAAEPSDTCGQSAEIPASTTPAGVGVRQSGDPYQEPTNVYVCTTQIAPGVVWARIDNGKGRAHLIVDGDSTNTLTPCSDGYLAVRADSTGAVKLHRSDDGNFSFFSAERTLEQVALGLAACVMPDQP